MKTLSYMKWILLVLICCITSLQVLAQKPITKVIDGKTYILHTVEKGQGAMAVARKYNITMSELAEANSVDLNKLYRNQVLKIPVPDTAKTEVVVVQTTTPKRDTNSVAAAHANAQEATVNRKPTQIHTVQQGESLNKIAQRYGVSVAELQKWNNISGNKIAVGQQLKINPFVNPTPYQAWNKATRPADPIIPLPVEQIIEEHVNVKWIEGDKVVFSKKVAGNVIVVQSIYEQDSNLLIKNVTADPNLAAGTILLGKDVAKRLNTGESQSKLLIKYTE